MKKRLRKKLYRGEFRELGFRVSFDANLDDPAELDDFFNDFIARVESRQLGFSGINGQHWEGTIARLSHGSVAASDQEFVQGLLESDARVANLEIGALVDLWQDEW